MAPNYRTFPSPREMLRPALKWMAGVGVLALCQGSPALATTCANAIVINPASLPIIDQALVCGTKDDLNDVTVPGLLCGGGSPLYKNGKEALYKFTPTLSGSYQLSFAGQGWSAAMVYVGCPTLNNCLGGFGDYTDTGSFSVYLNAGTTYYIWFDAWPDSQILGPCPGTFSFGPQAPPIINDDPCGATALTVNPDMTCTAQTPGTLAGATQTFGVATSPCAGNPNDDVWFKFTATGPTHYIFLHNVAGNTTDLVFGVYSGPCASLYNISCIHALNSSLTDLTPGSTYWVRVFSYSNDPANTTFEVCVTTPPPPPVCEEMFYDDGGPSGNYFDNTNTATTICPSTPGAMVSLVFSSFDLDFSDEFAVFDGNSTAAPFLDAYYGSTLPPTLTATNPTGCLTVTFYSDHDENYAGWAAQVICTMTTLPVELIALEATPNDPVIEVTWATATEHDSHHFTVEHSLDNITFIPIGTVAAAGNAQFRNDYLLVDQTPFRGVNYYRLEQVDIDGTTMRTHTVVATLSDGEGRPSIYPDPASDVLNVAFPRPMDEAVELVVLDALGRKVATVSTGAMPGQRTAQIPIGRLAPGWYNLRIDLPDGGMLNGGQFLKKQGR